jgi:hypothetical protein
MGVLGYGDIGVVGIADSAFGVVGSTEQPDFYSAGILGVARVADPNANLMQQGRAGWFMGFVTVQGYLQKAGGGFTVDHPLRPCK